MTLDFQLSNIQKNVRQLSDKVLLWQMEYLSKHERVITVLVLRHLREIETRRLFIELGFSSMHIYCIKHLKYSEGQTQRRLSSARLMTELPEIEENIKAGDLNVTNLAKFQSFAKSEKAVDHTLSRDEKLDLLKQIENKPTRQVERELIELSHQPALLAEKFHHTSVITTEDGVHQQYLKFEALLDEESEALLQEFKNLYAHELKDQANVSVLTFLLTKAVLDKKKQKGLIVKVNTNALPPPTEKVNEELQGNEEVKLVRIPLRSATMSSTVKLVWKRAQACCEQVLSSTGEKCGSKYALEIDHVVPIALGGSDDVSNLQLLCRAHNSRRAIKTFGVFGRAGRMTPV